MVLARVRTLLPYVCASLLAASLPASARPSSSAIEDRAGLFGAPAARDAERQIDEIRRDYGVKVVVETFEKPPSSWLFGTSFKKVAAMDSAAREQYFASLARKRASLRSIYVLICKEPAPVNVQVQVGRGGGLLNSFGAARCAALRTRITPLFRGNGNDQGLFETVQFVRQTLAASQEAKASESSIAWTTVLAIVLSILAVWVLGEAIMAYGSRRRAHVEKAPPATEDIYGFGGSVLTGLFAALSQSWCRPPSTTSERGLADFPLQTDSAAEKPADSEPSADAVSQEVHGQH